MKWKLVIFQHFKYQMLNDSTKRNEVGGKLSQSPIQFINILHIFLGVGILYKAAFPPHIKPTSQLIWWAELSRDDELQSNSCRYKMERFLESFSRWNDCLKRLTFVDTDFDINWTYSLWYIYIWFTFTSSTPINSWYFAALHGKEILTLAYSLYAFFFSLCSPIGTHIFKRMNTWRYS